MSESFDTAIHEFLERAIEEAMEPCPFCGQTAPLRILDSYHAGRPYYWIYCARTYGGCGAAQDARIYYSEEAAKTAWNTRANKDLLIRNFSEEVCKVIKQKLLAMFNQS